MVFPNLNLEAPEGWLLFSHRRTAAFKRKDMKLNHWTQNKNWTLTSGEKLHQKLTSNKTFQWRNWNKTQKSFEVAASMFTEDTERRTSLILQTLKTNIRREASQAKANQGRFSERLDKKTSQKSCSKFEFLSIMALCCGQTPSAWWNNRQRQSLQTGPASGSGSYPPVPSMILLSTKLKMSWNSCSLQGRDSGTEDTCSLNTQTHTLIHNECVLDSLRNTHTKSIHHQRVSSRGDTLILLQTSWHTTASENIKWWADHDEDYESTPGSGFLQNISRLSDRQRPAGDAGSGAVRSPRRAGCDLSNRKPSEETRWDTEAASRSSQIWRIPGLLPSCWAFFVAFWSRSEFSASSEECEARTQHVGPFSTQPPRHSPTLPRPRHRRPRCCSAAPSWREQTRPRPLRLSSGPAGSPEDSWSNR